MSINKAHSTFSINKKVFHALLKAAAQIDEESQETMPGILSSCCNDKKTHSHNPEDISDSHDDKSPE